MWFFLVLIGESFKIFLLVFAGSSCWLLVYSLSYIKGIYCIGDIIFVKNVCHNILIFDFNLYLCSNKTVYLI